MASGELPGYDRDVETTTDGQRAPESTPAHVPLAPLIQVPATTLGVQGTRSFAGKPVVYMQMTNAVVHCTFPMDLDQARQHVEDVQRAILEAQAVVTPEKKIELP